MSRFSFGTISLLRPEDEGLTAEEDFQVQVYRLLTLFGAGGLLLFGIARQLANPDAVDPIEARLAIVGLCLGLFGVSYVSSWVRRR